MLSQLLPSSAESYARDQRTEIGAALSAVQRSWRRMGDDFDASYGAIAGTLLTITEGAQRALAASAQDYIPAVLEETGQRRAVEARIDVNATSLVGTAGDGRPVETLLPGAVIHAKEQVAAGRTASQALTAGGEWLTMVVGTLLSDTGRASEKLAILARPVTGYVRMLNPPSCGRCVILAGQRSGTQAPFLRHPGCDCRNIPAAESIAGDLTVDPRAYLDDLDDASLARTLGSKANAQAFRDGADMNQLVNAYRKAGAVRPAQVYSRNVKYTTEGVTRRGFAYSRMSQADYLRADGLARARGGASGRVSSRLRAPRLMPESIAQIATDREDRIRLLRLYGWIV